MYKNSILECIGNTPLVKLNNIIKKYNLPFSLYAKVERFNPSGSIKDRASLYMIKEALDKNIINQNTIIVEPTSGNTGIGLAMICSYFKMKCVIFMPQSCSKERIKMMKAFGAEVVLTPSNKGMQGSVDEANKFLQENKNSFMPSQFENLMNPQSHYETTAIEILKDLDDKLDVLIAGIGTGGTISGIAKYYNNNKKNVEIIGVEPLSSPLITKGFASTHKIQGLGANFIPKTLDLNLINQVIDVSDDDAYKGSELLAREEGIFAGISSGASLIAALNLNKELYKDKNIVIILPDNGERYLSVEGLYE